MNEWHDGEENSENRSMERYWTQSSWQRTKEKLIHDRLSIFEIFATENIHLWWYFENETNFVNVLHNPNIGHLNAIVRFLSFPQAVPSLIVSTYAEWSHGICTVCYSILIDSNKRTRCINELLSMSCRYLSIDSTKKRFSLENPHVHCLFYLDQMKSICMT